MVEILHVILIIFFAAEETAREFLAGLGMLYFAEVWAVLELLPVLGILYFAPEGVNMKFWLC